MCSAPCAAQNAISKTGIIAGIVVAVVTALLALWTMYLLSALYQERKRTLVRVSAVGTS
jgi:amino acid permease